MAIHYRIDPNVVGLIVRGKNNDMHNPGAMEQHADCILPNGEPVGFFGGEGDASSGSSGPIFKSSISSWQGGPSVSLNSTGINMKGMVAHYQDLRRIRPYYVDIISAKKYQVFSTVLLLEVTASQATLFKIFWETLKLNPGSFNILGGNCSTKAAKAFAHAKIITGGIPGLDTPNNLYKHLKAKYKDVSKIFNGHIGAEPISGDRYDLVVA